MRIVKRAGQSGYDPGGYVPSGCQKLRERKSEHDRALAGARGPPYSESGSGLGTLVDLQQCQIVILVNRDDLCDAGLPATSLDRNNCATADNMRVRKQVPGLGDEKARSSVLCLGLRGTAGLIEGGSEVIDGGSYVWLRGLNYRSPHFLY